MQNIGHFSLHLVGSISDAPQIAKVCNSNQFNGYFGCIHCMTSCTVLPSRHHIYHYRERITLRTNTKYRRQVEAATISKQKYQGIKGSCWISKYISIPENIILDYMHLSCIGTLPSIIHAWNFSN